MERETEAFIYIVKYKDDDVLYKQITGDDDDVIQLATYAIIDDQRLTEAAKEAFKFFNNFGGQDRN